MKRLLRKLAVYSRRFGQVEVMDLLAAMRHEQHLFIVEQREILTLQQNRVEDALLQMEAILVTLALQQTEPPPPNSPPLQAQHAE